MNHKKVFSTIGVLLLVEGVLLLFPALVGFIFRESRAMNSFLIAAGITAAVGGILKVAFQPKNDVIYAKEGFAIVSLAWIAMSIFGALPLVISGEVNSYVDAFFEIVSGFTTTGASVFTDIENKTHALLFWRSFTHWIGGMGVLVFMMAILSNISDRSIHIMRAEMPGPTVGKIVPRAKDTAKLLYVIYIAMTVIQVILLCAGGMSFFESLLHTFGTAGTGGFGIKNDSIASYNSYLTNVITVFMLLFGVNFNLYYLLLVGKFKQVLKSSELKCFFIIVAVSVLIISLNILPLYDSFGGALEDAAFQVSSVITTTGYATADFNLWPPLSKSLLLMLMFIGACAGSTGGGLKVSRIMILFKLIFRELRQMLHPRSVNSVKLEGKPVDNVTLGSVATYFAVYVACIGVIFIILSIEPGFDFETNFTAAVACFNNIGPGFGLVGPSANFAGYSALSKLVLSAAMLLGRLEIFPLILACSPSTWRKR
ncbi:MAG: TrkH family potassium uptake protein [Oscillospiraceae bacterium]|nr:TrkH family potassium uptake protein [Oscillospiraceae bacterium]